MIQQEMPKNDKKMIFLDNKNAKIFFVPYR